MCHPVSVRDIDVQPLFNARSVSDSGHLAGSPAVTYGGTDQDTTQPGFRSTQADSHYEDGDKNDTDANIEPFEILSESDHTGIDRADTDKRKEHPIS